MKPVDIPVDTALLPRNPITEEALPPRKQPGYYPGFSTMSQSPFWEETTREVVSQRVQQPPKRTFFTEEAWTFWSAVFAHLIPQADRTADRQVPLVPMLDERLAKNKTVGYRYEDMPHDRVVYAIGIEAIDKEAEHRYGGTFLLLPQLQQDIVLQALAKGKPEAAPEIWAKMSVTRFWQMIMTDAIDAYYAHPGCGTRSASAAQPIHVRISVSSAANLSRGRWKRSATIGLRRQRQFPVKFVFPMSTIRAMPAVEAPIEDAYPGSV